MPSYLRMRGIRHLEPDRVWSITTRTVNAEYLLRPDVETTELIGFHLAKALHRFPGTVLYLFAAMSNHLHKATQDPESTLSAFMCYFLSNLARDINKVRRRSGPVFAQRFSSTPVLDDESLAERLVYGILNPVKAGLVDRHEDWPGVLVWSGSDGPRTFRRFRQRAFDKALRVSRRMGTPEPTREQFMESYELRLSPLPDGMSIEDILARVRAEEARFREERRENEEQVLGKEAVVEQDVRSRPENPKHSIKPLCHTISEVLREEFRKSWRALMGEYLEASAAWRAGKWRTSFPEYTFRPWVHFAVG